MKGGTLTTFKREARVDVPVYGGFILSTGVDPKRIPLSGIGLRSTRNIEGNGNYNWDLAAIAKAKEKKRGGLPSCWMYFIVKSPHPFCFN